jgi:tetratricopeptide (TPR) repeat protein
VLLRSGFQRIAIYRLDPSRNEELDAAIEELERAVDLIVKEDEKPANLSRAKHHLGRAYRHKADHLMSEGAPEEASRSYERALSEFEGAFALDGEDVASIGQVILIHRGMGRRKEAMDEAKSALPMVQGKGTRAQLLAMIGGLHLDDGNQVAAAEAFQESLMLDPNQPAALLYVVKIKQDQDEKEVAVAMLERALRRMPEFLEGQMMLAEARLALGRPGDAIAAFEAALVIPPEKAVLVDTTPSLNEARSGHYFTAASTLAWLYIDEQGDPAKARVAYELARLHRDQDTGLTATLGWIQHAEGDYEGALATLSGLAGKGDDTPQSRYYLALTLLKLNRQEEALREIERAIDSGVAFRGREDAEARMIEIWRRKAEARQTPEGSSAN